MQVPRKIKGRGQTNDAIIYNHHGPGRKTNPKMLSHLGCRIHFYSILTKLPGVFLFVDTEIDSIESGVEHLQAEMG